MEDVTTHEDADLGPPLVQSLWRHRWLLLLATVLGAAAGYGLSLLQPTVYQSTASLTLADPQAPSVLSDTLDPLNAEVLATNTLREADQVTSTAVLGRAAELLDGEVDPATLADRIAVTADTEVSTLEITGTGRSPGEAARLANATADAYQSVAVAAARADLQAAVAQLAPIRDRLLTRIQALGTGANTSDAIEREVLLTELVNLDTRIDELRTEIVLTGDGVEYREDATRPQSPAQPKPVRDAAIMAFLALVVAAVLAWWKAGRDTDATFPEDPATPLGAPLLGEVPRFEVAGTRTPAFADLSVEAAEFYHFVVVSLEAVVHQRQQATLLVVSPERGDGKTTTTRMLAAAMGMNGSRVVAVDADTRTRDLSVLAEADRHRGLTDLVSNSVDIHDCLVPLDESSPSGAQLVPAGGENGHRAPGLFRSEAFREALARIKHQADVVLVDTPAMMYSTDPFAMADDVDGIIVVVDRGTPMQVLEQTRVRLSLNRTPIVGYVFNRSAAGRAGWAVARGLHVRKSPEEGRTHYPTRIIHGFFALRHIPWRHLSMLRRRGRPVMK